MDPEVFSRSRADYGDRYEEHVLEQYKIFVETEERLVSRRQEENRFFLSVNSLLLAFMSFLLRDGLERGQVPVAVALLGVAGVALCASWFFIIDSYKTLNEAKFATIDQFERQLPARMFGAEWEAAEARKYRSFTRIEKVVPFVFGGLSAIGGAIGLGQAVGAWTFS